MTLAIAEPTKTLLPNKTEFYDTLDIQTADYAKNQAIEFKKKHKEVSGGIKELGAILRDTKKQLGHGNFLRWIDLEFKILYGVGEQSAQDLIRNAELLEKSPSLAKFAPSVLTELSRQSTPQPLIEEAIALAESNQDLTVAEVKQKRKEAIPKPKFVKGNFVEFGKLQKEFGQIKAVSSKEPFTYKIKHLHGPSFGGKFSEEELTLCPVQERKNFYDDCTNQPKAGEKVIFNPITSWNQDKADKEFVVVASVSNGVYLKNNDSQSTIRYLVHWAELIPVSPLEQQPPEPQPLQESFSMEQGNLGSETEVVVDVKSETVLEWVDEPLLTFKDLETASDDQLSDLFSKISLEIQERIDTSVKIELDSLVDQVWEEIKDLDQRKKEQFLVLLIDRTF